MRIGIPVHDGVDLLDVAGPIEMFTWAPDEAGLETIIISRDGSAVTSLNGVTIGAHLSFADAGQLDILWVPGHEPETLSQLMSGPDKSYIHFLQDQAKNAKYVCSVCEGALLLAQAGLLDGYAATTHWMFVNCLKRFPEIRVDETNPRFVLDRNRLTGGGISSGLDEALKLIELVAGTEAAVEAQIATQYFPAPPVHGAIPKAPACPVHF